MSSPLLQRYIIRQRQANGKASNTTLTTRLPGTSLMDFFWLELMTSSSITSAWLTLKISMLKPIQNSWRPFWLLISKSVNQKYCVWPVILSANHTIFSDDVFLILLFNLEPQNEPSVQSVQSAESVNISFQCHYEPGQGTEGKFEDIRRLEVGRLRIRHWMFW